MLYDIGYKTELEPNTTERSNQFTIFTEAGLSTISVNSGASLIVNGADMGSSTNVVDGATVEIVGTSGSTHGVPRFFQFYQDGEQEGTFVLINKFELRFEYNDALNGKYAWEVLPDSTWVPSDNGSIGVLFEDTLTFTDLEDREIDFTQSSSIRNKVHVLDYYLNQINVLDSQGNYLGRVEDLAYSGPIDVCTVYKSASESRLLLAVAYEQSDKIAFYTNTYVELDTIDIVQPVSVTSVLNNLFIAQRNTNVITVVTFNDDGSIDATNTVTLAKKPHRLYQIGGYCAVLTETSIEFLLGDTIDSSFSLPQFASALAYDVLNERIYVTHRQERKVTKISLDFTNGHTIDDTIYMASQGYFDSIVYSSTTDTIYVSDIVEKEILIFDENLSLQEKIDLDDRHSYEMFINASGTRLILSCLYPDIDARLIISDGDPDPITYTDVEDIALGQTVSSPFYEIDGVMEPVTLYMFPDDSDVNVGVNVGGTTYTYGVAISPGETFNFEVSLPKGSARRIEFVVGLHVYSFNALPNSQRIIPAELIFEPIVYAELDTVYQSNTITVYGLDVEPCPIEVQDGTATIVKNGVNQGTSTSVVNGDEFYLLMASSDTFAGIVYSTIRYGNLFDTSWAIIARELDELTDDTPEASADFIDVQYAELSEDYVSEPITITLTEPTASFEINDDYGAVLIVDGVEVGTSFPVSDVGDYEVQIKLTTEPVFSADHQITLTMSKLAVTWVVTTMPVETIVPMEFGAISGVTLGDRVTSDSVVLDSVAPEYTVGVFVPRNTRLFVNGYPASVDVGRLNYRGVLRYDTLIRVAGGSTIHLEGYALGRYGTVTNHTVRAGLSRGVWYVQSIELTDAIESREIIPYGFDRTATSIEDKVEIASINPTFDTIDIEAHIVDIERTAVDTGLNMYAIDGKDATVATHLNSYYGTRGSNVYNKASRALLTAQHNGFGAKSNPHRPTIDTKERTYVRSIKTTSFVNIANAFIRSQPGITVTVPDVQFERSGKVGSYSVESLFLRSDNPTWVTLEEKAFDRSSHNPLFSENQYWSKRIVPDNMELDKTWRKDATVKIVLFNGDIVKYGGYSVLAEEQEFIKDRPLVHTHVEEYVRDGILSPTTYALEYFKEDRAKVLGYTIPYEKRSFTYKINSDFVWITHHRSVHVTPLWLDIESTTTDYAAANVLVTDISENVDVPLLDYPSYSFGYNLRVDVHTSQAELTSIYTVEKDNYAHPEMSTVLPAFMPVKTFSYSMVGSPAVIVNAEDCLNLGNESCLQEGMFATEQEAMDDAVINWGVDSIAVRTSEISDGCWIWSQVLPCVNSCYSCPDKGYLFGG